MTDATSRKVTFLVWLGTTLLLIATLAFFALKAKQTSTQLRALNADLSVINDKLPRKGADNEPFFRRYQYQGPGE